LTNVNADFSDVAVDENVRIKLRLYVRRLLERNETLNLTGARDVASVMDHVRDSLAIVRWVAEPHVDIGSGGGFPAIPLAIVTGFRMTLIESVAKKAAFLRQIVAELGLRLDVVAGRAEDAGRAEELRSHFGSATARAVASVPVVLELTLPLVAVGGVAILQRGHFDEPERHATADALLVLGGELVEEALPHGPADARRVLVVRKHSATNQRFPRRAGIPAKRPLCPFDA
jgi:16S rRNA (guanine527-N7)-methyltransferase